MTGPQEVVSNNISVLPAARHDTSVLPVARLSTNRRFTVELEYRQLTFTTAPEQQVEHYQAENNNTNVSTLSAMYPSIKQC